MSPAAMPTPDAQGMARLDVLADDLASLGVAFERAQMFGSPGLRLPGKGKFFASLIDEGVIFKLDGERHAEALALPGAHLFEPMPGRAMKQWVVVPFAQDEHWPELGRSAATGLGGGHA